MSGDYRGAVEIAREWADLEFEARLGSVNAVQELWRRRAEDPLACAVAAAAAAALEKARAVVAVAGA